MTSIPGTCILGGQVIRFNVQLPILSKESVISEKKKTQNFIIHILRSKFGGFGGDPKGFCVDI